MHSVRKWIVGMEFVASLGVTLMVPLMVTLTMAPQMAFAQTDAGGGTPGAPPATRTEDGSFLLTIFLKHDQSKPLPKINQELAEQGFYKAFPPPGVEVVSWYVMMGIGQVVTLKVPANRLRDVNRAIEETAWGGYHTEFYPTYDYKALAEQARKKNGQ